MSHFPKPSFVISKSDLSLVWFETTNHFLVLDDGVLKIFFVESIDQTESEYCEALEALTNIYPEILNLIDNISLVNKDSLINDVPGLDYSSLSLEDFKVSNLLLNKQLTSVYYNSKEVQKLFQAPFVHLDSGQNKTNKELVIADYYNQLYLFSNKKLIYSTQRNQFFILQAQFVNQLIENYHNINNSNWLCSFHACAIQKKDKTYLLLGDSGAGKSTLSLLLSLSNYRFIADDLVVMDHNFKIYDNPAAVSVKENSWSIVKKYYNNYDSLAISDKTKKQTKIKFLPLHQLQNNTPESFEVEALVWVHYSEDNINSLSPLDRKQALSRLIPDTWINYKVSSAKAFANWAMNIKTYHLDYKNFNIAKKLLDEKL